MAVLGKASPVKAAAAAMAAAVVLACSSALAAPEAASEYDIKAAMLIKLTAFITWPADKAQQPAEGESPAQQTEGQKGGDKDLRIAITGDDPFGRTIHDLAQRASQDGHTITVAHEDMAAAAERCHMVFITQSEKERLGDMLAQVSGRPVLTISDIPGFAEAGGMIELEMQERRVTLVINQGALQKAGIEASSKLLNLARLVLFRQDGAKP